MCLACLVDRTLALDLSLEAFGGIWKHLEAFIHWGGVLGGLKAFGNIWKYLEAFWKHSESIYTCKHILTLGTIQNYFFKQSMSCGPFAWSQTRLDQTGT